MKIKLPIIQCDAGCSDCCGPAPCTDRELEVIRAHVAEHGIVPIDQGITCPLFLDGRCSVYEVRPRICQLFGHSERLLCSRGYNRNITPRAEREFLNGYREPTRFVHEVLPDSLERLLGHLRAGGYGRST